MKGDSDINDEEDQENEDGKNFCDDDFEYEQMKKKPKREK